MHLTRAVLLMVALASAAPRALSAQRQHSARASSPSLGFDVGTVQADPSTLGSAFLIGVHLDVPLGTPTLLGQASVRRFRGDTLDGDRAYIISELQLRAIAPVPFVAPYLAVGGGWFHSTGGDPRGQRDEGTLSASLGLQARPLQRLLVNGEVRGRIVGTYYPTGAGEFTFGASVLF